MKKVLVLLVMAIITMNVSAQDFKKKDKFVEGTVSYSKTTGTKAEYSLRPTVGCWITDRVSVGVFGEITKAASDRTGIGAFARCKVLTIKKNLNVFSQVDVLNTTTDVAGVRTSTFGSNLGFGAYYFVSNRLALNMNLANIVSYSTTNSKSILNVGFGDVNNPFSAARFGVTYRF